MKDKGWMDTEAIYKKLRISKTCCVAFLSDVLLLEYVERRRIPTFNKFKFQWRWLEEGTDNEL